MELITTISVAVIAICMFAIAFSIVGVAARIRGLVREVEKLVEITRMHMPPLIHDVTQITSDVRSIVRHVERDIPKLTGAFDAVRDTAHEIYDLERTVRKQIEGPLLQISALIGGVLSGVYAFWRTLFR